MSFLLEVIEFTLAGFFVGLGFWFAFVGVAFVCGFKKIIKGKAPVRAENCGFHE